MHVYRRVKPDVAYRVKGDPHAFIPVFDSTDHMTLACKHCKEIAEILMVERDDSYARTPTLYLYARCPKCDCQGYRKIYLEDMGKHWLRFPKITELLAQTAEEARAGIIKVTPT